MVHIAILMLEFLSKLISLPKVFASFSTEQFLSVFAIILPYSVGPTLTPSSSTTTPSPSPTSHHGIIMWFLKCRLTQKKDFVKCKWN